MLGNMAMSAYMLAQLFTVQAAGPLAEVFTRRQPGRLVLPAALTVFSIVIYLLA
jgi:hypothetical protein